MTTTDLLADTLTRNLEMVKSTLADFSDADMLVRPAPGANHVAWQLGHFTNSERNMVNLVKPGVMPPAPDGFVERFSRDNAKLDDASAFPRKDELLREFAAVRAASIQWVKSLSPADLDQPAPERLRRLAANVGQMCAMMPNHVAMHVGQFQVIRRKLGKPVLF